MDIDLLKISHEECGVFGIFGSPDVALTALGLHSLQHRGHKV